MGRKYLKVKYFRCPKCKERLEAVVSGYLNKRKKEQVFTEKIIGYCCRSCNFKQKIEI